ncbi:MAG: hypothetical protein GDA52_05690 [Rhodobacteraceae bacterium]|nr:hypothetical protein [Paracoccaceae bacterium]
MSDSTPQVTKVRLKVGSMELEYEGDPAFLSGGVIEDLLETMAGLVDKVPLETSTPVSAEEVPHANADGIHTANGGSTFSTATIAARLDSKTGPDLAICAMAQLQIVQKKKDCSRSDILAEMQSATSYYKASMGRNLTASLTSLVKNKLINGISKATYALSAEEMKKIEGQLADIG